MKAIISGGGSGGHIFPAVAIANAIKARHADAQILFVGAQGRMEMEKVPAAGYEIKGLPIAGLQRQLSLVNIWKNLQLPFRVIASRCKVRGIIRSFNPDIVVGVGGFASEPTLKVAARMGYTTLLQEQNSYAGLANRTLARQAAKICVAYEGMERFFPKEKIVFTGNPVRADIEQMQASRSEALGHFGLDGSCPVVLVVGGSLGARSINRMVLDNLGFFEQNGIQLIWQTGSGMYAQAAEAVAAAGLRQRVKVHQFISRMDLAYTAADAVVSRAGAIAISELCLVGKPAVLIPSPNVAEDHQTKNALALVNKDAALYVKDVDAQATLIELAIKTVADSARLDQLSANVKKLGKPNAASDIADEVIKLAKK